MNNHAVFPGTFDPFTQGHASILNQACTLFNKITIAVIDKDPRATLFSTDTRTDAIKALTQNQQQIEVIAFSGLLIDWMKEQQHKFIVRGIRNQSDVSYELAMAHHNRDQHEDITTLFIPTQANESWISSTLVRELMQHKGRVEHLIPMECLNVYQNHIYNDD
jgi:pantetheine-phosphate adenylyltransferase